MCTFYHWLLWIFKFIIIPFFRILDDVIFNPLVFPIISNDVIVVIGLEKVVVPIVFRDF